MSSARAWKETNLGCSCVSVAARLAAIAAASSLEIKTHFEARGAIILDVGSCFEMQLHFRTIWRTDRLRTNSDEQLLYKITCSFGCHPTTMLCTFTRRTRAHAWRKAFVATAVCFYAVWLARRRFPAVSCFFLVRSYIPPTHGPHMRVGIRRYWLLPLSPHTLYPHSSQLDQTPLPLCVGCRVLRVRGVAFWFRRLSV